jgi:hypothetical protein
MIRVILGMLAVAVSLFAAYYVYSPGSDTIAFQWYGFNGIAVEQYPIRLGEGFNPDVKDVTPDGKYVKVGHYGVRSVMSASPWLLDGTPIEYTYTRVTALFNATDVDPKRDVKWLVYTIHFKSIWEELPVGVMYELNVVVKEGYGPVLDFNCLKLVKMRSSVTVYNATCPGNTAAMYSLSAYYLNAYNGKRMFCVYVYYFKQDVWYRARGWGFGSMYDYFCKPWDKPPRNLTATVSPWGLGQSRVDIYVDGTPVYTLWVRNNYAKFYTGPYDLATLGITTAEAYIGLRYPGIIHKPLGTVFLLIGNDTIMTPPKYVVKAYSGITQARVELRYDHGVTVLPGRTYDNSTVYAWPTVLVRIHGRPAELPYRALVNAAKLCPGGAVVSGRYSWVGGWVEVKGARLDTLRRVPSGVPPAQRHLPGGAGAFQQDVCLDAPAHRLPQRHQAGGRPSLGVCRRAEGGARKLHAGLLPRAGVATPLGVANETWTPRGVAVLRPGCDK